MSEIETIKGFKSLTSKPAPTIPSKYQTLSESWSGDHTSPLGKNSRMLAIMDRIARGMRDTPIHFAHFPVHMVTT